MIRRIVVQDFMAHKHTELELHPGVNVLTGPNNTGKSAVVEALRCVAENPPSKELIRHGASRAVVRLELDDGSAVQWERTAESVVYKLENAEGREETYAKMGRGVVPEDVRAALRIQSLKTESGAIDIHIGNQKTPIFLLDQTGSQAAAFFAASTEAEYLLQMQQELNVRTAMARQAKKDLDAAVAKKERELERFGDLPRLDRLLQNAEDLYEAVQKLGTAIPALEGFLRSLEGTLEQKRIFFRKREELRDLEPPPGLVDPEPLRRLLADMERTRRLAARARRDRDALSELAAPPRLRDARSLGNLVESLARTRRFLDAHRKRADVLGAAAAPPILRDVPGLEAVCSRLDALRRLRDRNRKRRETLARLPEPPDLHKTDALEAALGEAERLVRTRAGVGRAAAVLSGLQDPPPVRPAAALAGAVSELARARAARKTAARRAERLKSLRTPPELLPTAALERACARMGELTAEQNRLEDRRRALERDLSAARQEIRRLIERAGVCPFCRQPMDLDHFLEETAADGTDEREDHGRA